MVKNHTHIRPAAVLAALLFAFAAFSATSATSAATGVSPAAVIAPALTPEFSAAIADARTEVAELVASEGGASSLSLALVDGDSVIWSESFGYLDRTRDLRPDADTRYGLASGSKMFAALSVMILADRGLVDLDAPFVSYVPEFRMRDGEAYGRITTRMLLSHSSGFPGSDYRNGTTFAPVPNHVAQILQGLADQRLKHAPGEMAMYCNDGFSLVELLVERKTGLSYGEFVKKEILRPLGMRLSGLGTETFEPGSYAAKLDDAGRPYPQEYINVLGTGGIYSTSGELAKLAMMFLGKGRLGDRRILSEAAILEMGANQSSRLASNPFGIAGYGLGWDSVGEPWKDGALMPLWRKNGGSVYYSTQFDIAPEAGLGMVMLAAGARFDLEDYSKELFAKLIAAKGAMKALPARELAPVPAAVPTAVPAEGIDGYYTGALLTRVRGSAADALTMSISYMEQWIETVPGLRARPNCERVSEADPATAYFVTDISGVRYLAKRDRTTPPLGGGIRIVGRKLDPPGTPLSPAWKSRLGKRWLVANDPYSAFSAMGMVKPGFSIREDAALPGYIVASPWGTGEKALDPRTGDMRALMIGDYGARDISDLVVTPVNGEEWIKWGTSLYRPMETVTSLAPGAQVIRAAPGVFGEWRVIPRDAKLEVADAASWYLYDGEFNLLHSEVEGIPILRGWNGTAPAASYLVVYVGGSGGARVTLK